MGKGRGVRGARPQLEGWERSLTFVNYVRKQAQRARDVPPLRARRDEGIIRHHVWAGAALAHRSQQRERFGQRAALGATQEAQQRIVCHKPIPAARGESGQPHATRWHNQPRSGGVAGCGRRSNAPFRARGGGALSPLLLLLLLAP